MLNQFFTWNPNERNSCKKRDDIYDNKKIIPRTLKETKKYIKAKYICYNDFIGLKYLKSNFVKKLTEFGKKKICFKVHQF